MPINEYSISAELKRIINAAGLNDIAKDIHPNADEMEVCEAIASSATDSRLLIEVMRFAKTLGSANEVIIRAVDNPHANNEVYKFAVEWAVTRSFISCKDDEKVLRRAIPKINDPDQLVEVLELISNTDIRMTKTIANTLLDMALNSDFADERVFATAVSVVDKRASSIREGVFKTVISKTTMPETLVSIIEKTNDPSVVKMAVNKTDDSTVLEAANRRAAAWLGVLSAIANKVHKEDPGFDGLEFPTSTDDLEHKPTAR